MKEELSKYSNDWTAITKAEANQLERNTRLQNECNIWHKERQKRITASHFGTIMNRKKDCNESFLQNTFKNSNFKSKPTSYGQVNEKVAKTIYIKKRGCHLHSIGLVVNPLCPFLGASPDGVVCKDGQSGLIEIKCPYAARDFTVREAIEKVKLFCLEIDEGEDQISLKRSHNYFYQVQGQIMITGAP
ncbi:hypothetical protein AALO_G00113600 [Alosa alosa]|uniref:YqaJ viral recombinase domain-containing protein n=1 Tax=Alosa alosa TaxID=278164 RepID=A0AAV6GU00_9TELE|nr:hypothetical protein AALO_G00113600 [Alosa alosa]